MLVGTLSHGGGLDNPWTYLALVALVGAVVLFRLATRPKKRIDARYEYF